MLSPAQAAFLKAAYEIVGTGILTGTECPHVHRQMPNARICAEIVKNNQLLHQLAQQFPRTHTDCSVSTFDFQAAWNQASFLAFQKSTPSSSNEPKTVQGPFSLLSNMYIYPLTVSVMCRAYITSACSFQVNEV